ncbi:winged helix-turn-helix domain-containing protein [Thermodesulfobacteriota bacterium]
MEIQLKIALSKSKGFPFMGPGPLRLLEKIREYKSIHKAAKSMNLSYVKALNMMNRLEKSLDQKMLLRTRGGNDGGGTQLTQYAETYIALYKTLEQNINEYAQNELSKLSKGIDKVRK